MKVMTLPQVKALASLDGWRPSVINVGTDFVTTPGSSHGEGTFLLATVWGSNKDGTDQKLLIEVGIAPNGDMQSR